MGSIVGAMYGSGLSISQIEEIVTRAPFSKLLNFNFIQNDSILETAKVNKFIENIAPDKKLENFRIPTALLSLELNSGNKYLITTGKISEVLQASYAIPYFFPPHQIENNYFADPGIVENSPAKAAKALGANFIIATTSTSNIHEDTYKSPEKIVNRYVEIVGDRNTERILNNYADLVIKSNVKNYSFIDFSMAKELIDIGYKDAKQKMEQLKEKLNNRQVQLTEPTKRKNLDLSQQFDDIKYDRMLVDAINFDPIIHYGQDYSFFKQDLLRSYLDHPQYGFKFDKDHIDFNLLATNNEDNDLETKLRWRKLTKKIDLINKIRFESNSNDDAELGLRYYNGNYSLETGLGVNNKENYIFLNNRYQHQFNNFNLAGEVDLFFNEINQSPELLLSNKASKKISSIWSIEPKLVFSNTKLIEAPIIYRGTKPTSDYPKLQLSLDYSYTHKFLQAVKLTKIIQIKDIGAYLFTDYLNDNNESIAYGIGFDSDFYLLGLKPFRVEGYLSYDQEIEESIVKINLNYNF